MIAPSCARNNTGFEVGFIPVTEDGRCGVQFCNLTSINGAKIKTAEDFMEASKAITIIGTLQAAYTYFPYLNNETKFLTEEEALLGCSMTGMMDNPDILLNPKLQREAAKVCVDVNRDWAHKIGINQAARITVIKPSGNSSLVLGSASGIHAHHARKYIRRVQCNKVDNVYKYFKKHNPHMCEESIWSENKTDDVIMFPIVVPETAMIKEDLTALEHLKYIKSTQENWILPGTTEINKKPVSHNVSCTVIVKNSEWNEVANYLYDNKQFFAAVSLLPSFGDKLYKQAPLEKLTDDPEDIKRWNDIVASFKHVDYKKLIEETDETALQQEAGCAGGNCEVTMDGFTPVAEQMAA